MQRNFTSSFPLFVLMGLTLNVELVLSFSLTTHGSSHKMSLLSSICRKVNVRNLSPFQTRNTAPLQLRALLNGPSSDSKESEQITSQNNGGLLDFFQNSRQNVSVQNSCSPSTSPKPFSVLTSSCRTPTKKLRAMVPLESYPSFLSAAFSGQPTFRVRQAHGYICTSLVRRLF
jgi:hypothetical protein